MFWFPALLQCIPVQGLNSSFRAGGVVVTNNRLTCFSHRDGFEKGRRRFCNYWHPYLFNTGGQFVEGAALVVNIPLRWTCRKRLVGLRPALMSRVRFFRRNWLRGAVISVTWGWNVGNLFHSQRRLRSSVLFVGFFAFFTLLTLTWLTSRVPGRMVWPRHSTLSLKMLNFLIFSMTSGFFECFEDLIDVCDVFIDGVGIYNDVFKIYQTVFSV